MYIDFWGLLERDPDSKAPENGMQKLANLIHKLYLWTKTPEALVRCTPIVVAYDRD